MPGYAFTTSTWRILTNRGPVRRVIVAPFALVICTMTGLGEAIVNGMERGYPRIINRVAKWQDRRDTRS
jgi:hypothetical protein